MHLTKVNIVQIAFWNGKTDCPSGYLPPHHLNYSKIIEDAVTFKRHPCVDPSYKISKNPENKRFWYTGWEYDDELLVCVQVKEEGDIDENTKWFYKGEQVYPVDD